MRIDIVVPHLQVTTYALFGALFARSYVRLHHGDWVNQFGHVASAEQAKRFELLSDRQEVLTNRDEIESEKRQLKA